MFGFTRRRSAVLSRKHRYTAVAGASVLAITGLFQPIPAQSGPIVDKLKLPGVIAPEPGGKQRIIPKDDFEIPALPKAPLPNLTGPLPKLAPAPSPLRKELIRLRNYGPYVPTVVRVPTTRKIAFITIDDGGYQPAKAPALMSEAKVPSSQFLIYGAVNKKRTYFRMLENRGSRIQNHTLSHPHLNKLTMAKQRQEICTAHSKLGTFASHKPTLFRPPYGEYNLDTLRVLPQCGGIQANVLWEGSMIGGQMHISNKLGDNPNKKLKPGMIVLLHFTKNFEADFRGALTKLKKEGYTVARLEDYITA